MIQQSRKFVGREHRVGSITIRLRLATYEGYNIVVLYNGIGKVAVGKWSYVAHIKNYKEALGVFDFLCNLEEARLQGMINPNWLN